MYLGPTVTPDGNVPDLRHLRTAVATAHQPFLTQLGDRLFCNAFADFKNLGKIAHWRNDFAPSKRVIDAWT